MSILKSDSGKELIVTCRCGCDDGLHIRIDHDEDSDDFCYMSLLNNNFYRDQNKNIRYVVWEKLKKIWFIIRGKDFYYSDILMTRQDFEIFREYINGVK